MGTALDALTLRGMKRPLEIGRLSNGPGTGRHTIEVMDTNEFVEKLLSQVSLETIDFASDVERVLAEQVVFLRDQVQSLRRETVLEDHAIVRQLYERLADKDRQLEYLQEEIRYLRSRRTSTSS